MAFTQIQEGVLEVLSTYRQRFDVAMDSDYALGKLVEELGKVSNALLQVSGKVRPEKKLPPAEAKANLAAELSDVIGMTILLADLHEIDLEQAFREKWFDKL